MFMLDNILTLNIFSDEDFSGLQLVVEVAGEIIVKTFEMVTVRVHL